MFKNSVFSYLLISGNIIPVAFCLIRSLFATFLGYIARYAPSNQQNICSKNNADIIIILMTDLG